MVFSFDDSVKTVAKLKVVGVGGAGGNAINRMVASGLQGVEFIAVNTDAMALEHNRADIKIQIGTKLTGGLGAGANPNVGNLSMQEDRERVRAQLEGADMVFIAAGMGGGTGTGAAPVVAEIAREMGILTVAVVTKPFLWEGPVRDKNATGGLDALRRTWTRSSWSRTRNCFPWSASRRPCAKPSRWRTTSSARPPAASRK